MIAPSAENLAYASIALRAFGFVLSLPLGDALNTFPRFFLAAGLAFALRPVAQVLPDLSVVSLIFEFVLGFILGAPLRFVVDATEMVGELIDTARGQTVSAVIDPLHGQGSSDLAALGKNAAVTFALWGGALDVSLEGLAYSVQAIPIGSPIGDGSLAGGIFRTGMLLLAEGLRICAVWVGAFLIIDLGCAIASRLVNGLSFSQTGGVLKMIVTFILLIVLFTEGGRISTQSLQKVFAPLITAASPQLSPPSRAGGSTSQVGGQAGIWGG